MKIAIDISPVVYGTGVSVYTENLARNLLLVDKVNEYVLFGGSLRRAGELREFVSSLKGHNLQDKIFPIPPTLAAMFWNKVHLVPIELFIGKIDVFHSSDWTQPPSGAFKVTTVHDLAPIKLPRFTHHKIVTVHKQRLNWVVKEVDRVIVPSQSTKADLADYGVNKDKIRVIPEAPSPIFKPAKKDEIERLKKKYQIFGKYLLAVGVNPRKNTKRIIDAFHLTKAGEDIKLVLVGESAFMEKKEERDIRIVGHVRAEEMPIFYSGAETLVYPSIYEGFGLPILEAFACGCPVVTSNVSSLPEVAGDAAILVDPYDVGSIVDGTKQALRNKKTLASKGFARVKEFNWTNVAKRTLDVYKESGIS